MRKKRKQKERKEKAKKTEKNKKTNWSCHAKTRKEETGGETKRKKKEKEEEKIETYERLLFHREAAEGSFFHSFVHELACSLCIRK